MASGLSVIATSPASANLQPVGTNIPLGSDQPVAGVQDGFSGGWTAPNQGRISSVTWSPALTGGRFVANTVYSAIVTVTPVAFISEFESTNANTFTVSNGAATGTTVTHDAIAQGASSAVIRIAFPATGELVTRVITSTSTITSGAVNPQITVRSTGPMDARSSNWTFNFGTTGLTLNRTNSAVVGTIVFTFSGTAANGTLTVQGGEEAFVISPSGPSNTLSFIVTGGGSSPAPSQTAEEIAAAAAEAAASFAAAIAKAKSVLASQFSANKPATVEQFQEAGYGVRNENVAAKVSDALLKLSATDRENAQKVNEIISLENFIDRAALTDTRSTVRSTELVSRGLLPADSTYKHSVVQGLASYPNGSLNSLEKIAAAVKEQIEKAEAPKRRLAEIKAKIAARKR